MEEELTLWLDVISANIIEKLGNVNLVEEECDFKTKSIIILNYVQTEEKIQTFEDIYHFLSKIYSSSYLSLEDDVSVLEHLLVYCLTISETNRRTELLRITSEELDHKTQLFVVGVIQDITPPSTTVEVNVSSATAAITPVKASASQKSAISTAMTTCEECGNYERRIKQLQQEIAQSEVKHEEQLKEIKQSLLSKENKLLDEEVVLLQKDSEIFNLQKQLNELQNQLQEYHELQLNSSEMKVQLAKYQDEVQIFQEKTERFSQLETSYNKLRDKYEELMEMKQQLRSETSSHQVTYAKLIEAEKELEDLRKLKPLLETYRSELSEKTIMLDDVKYQLAQKEGINRDLQQKLDHLQRHHSSIMEEREQLSSQLSCTSEELRTQQRGSGIGEGVSEFNPVLMQELMKLREENTNLQSQLQATSVETLERLSKENADLSIMNQSLIEKWNTTKSDLQHANQCIESLESELAKTKMDYEIYLMNLKQDHSNLTEQLREELRQNKEEYKNTISQLTDNYENELAQLKEQHQKDIEALQDQHRKELARLHGEREKEVEAMKLQHDRLSIDLEEEKNKRRKVERLKKLFESESQRQKLQLSALQNGSQGLGNGDSADLQTAAKEMKTMQEQLNAAQAEIHTLKALLENTATSASVSAGGSSTHGKALKPSSSSSSSGSSVMIHTYLEHAEVTDKRIEQLEREKRDILSRALEDNKEKMELSQKLLFMDKENHSLKTEVRKLTLEKERIERKLLKESLSSDASPLGNKENLSL